MAETSEFQKTVKPFNVDNSLVLAIAWPTTLAYLTTPLLGIVDTGVIGQLDSAAVLGGLAIGAILFDIIFTTFNFLRSSTTGLVAQAMGAGDEAEQKVVLLRALVLSAVIGLFVMAVSPFILHLGVWALGVTGEVEAATRTYFSIRVLATPLSLLNYAILGWILGQARAQLGLALQILLSGSNIILSLLLGLHFGWGIEGVAWATVAAEGIATVFGLAIAYRHYRGHGFPTLNTLMDGAALKRLFGVNRDIMIRSFVLFFAFAFFAAQGARFDENTLAANAVLMNFFMVSGYFLDGFATAAEQLAGRAIGARYRPAFDKSVRLCLLWGFVLAAFATVIYFAFGKSAIDFLVVNEAVRQIAYVYLPWAALTALFGVVAFQMDGVFIGATWSKDMRNMMLVSLVIYIIVWYISVPYLKNHGLWLALEVFLGVRGITLYRRLKIRADETFKL